MLTNQVLSGNAKRTPPAGPAAPDFSDVKTAQDFATRVIGRADLSRAASRVAVDKASRADIKEFAGYELMEAETVVAVLKDLGTPLPAMDAATKSALEQIVGASAGGAFDVAYMTAEYENHVYLRDLADAYLRNASSKSADVMERHGQHLAQVALFAFTEHAGITHRILKEIAA